MFALCVRWTFALIGIAGMFIIVGAARAETTRTTCYDSGRDRICETKTEYGAVVSKSRCYQSGKDTRCDSEGAPPSVLPVPPTGRRP